jgi:curli production assembly/transport component CsgG
LLKSLEDSKWFTPIERENVSNLLNERQIIRSTRQEYAKDGNKKNQTTSIPPLLFAGILLEGGVVSYDSNIITGGSGARYFGAGGSVQYREDRITIYLRAVSTSNGQILKTVYISKTILSQSISASLFRYVSLKRLLEVETGVTRNEPGQLAVKEAIDKAVETLIVEGIVEGIWKPQGGDKVIAEVKEKYEIEKAEAASTLLLNRKFEDRRGKQAFNFGLGATFVADDYSNPIGKFSTHAAYKFYFDKPTFYLSAGLSYFELENKDAFKESFMSFDLNFGYDILPYESITPTIYIGVGTMTDLKISNPFFEFQYGVGVEFLPVNNLGIVIFGEQNILFSDNLEGVEQGKYNDFYWRVGFGFNFYFGSPYKKVNSKLF